MMLLNKELRREVRMKKLEKSFTKKGYRYSQMWRNEKFAIYLRENDVPSDAADYYYYYELIRIKKRKKTVVLCGMVLPPSEVYPADKDWGTIGWTFFSLIEAERKLNELINGNGEIYQSFPQSRVNVCERRIIFTMFRHQ